jgi:hypothetical protein
MVLCYHLQHPSLYSLEALREGIKLLTDFVDKGLTPQQIRERNRLRLSSANRKWKIKGTPESHGSYPHAMNWPMTAADVTAGGKEDYCACVKAWARSICEVLKATALV